MINNHVSFVVSSNPAVLAALEPCATVEAEYGDTCVEGRLLTMAHHGPRSGNPAPCSGEWEIPEEEIECVGLSHFDLDSLGGCMAILGLHSPSEFWALAAFVDVNGPHRLAEVHASAEALRQLNAFWAWSEGNRVFPPRDGNAADITKEVMAAVRVVQRILDGDEDLLSAGDSFRERGEELNRDSFVECRGDVIVRVAPSFVNHLYVTPDGEVARAVVAFNTVTGAVTVSFADEESRGSLTAREIVQKLWGNEAGGHAGIAGSPRGERIPLYQLQWAIDDVKESLEDHPSHDGDELSPGRCDSALCWCNASRVEVTSC